MSRVYEDPMEFLMDLEDAVDNAMQGPIADKAIEKIQEVGEKRFYNAYEPRFLSREEKDGGGMISEKTMLQDYFPESKTLVITLDAEWQNIGFRKVDGSGRPNKSLADVVQTTKIYHAPARSFVPEAEEEYTAKRFEIDLGNSLRQQGFVVNRDKE